MNRLLEDAIADVLEIVGEAIGRRIAAGIDEVEPDDLIGLLVGLADGCRSDADADGGALVADPPGDAPGDAGDAPLPTVRDTSECNEHDFND